MITLHAYFAAEYTLTAMLTGTFNLAVVPELQGARRPDPKARVPIFKRDVGSVMLDNLVQDSKAFSPTEIPLVGISTLRRLVHS